jgi:hypothetical protein
VERHVSAFAVLYCPRYVGLKVAHALDISVLDVDVLRYTTLGMLQPKLPSHRLDWFPLHGSFFVVLTIDAANRRRCICLRHS